MCQRLVDNDRSLKIVDLTHPRRINDIYARGFAKALEENNVVSALILSCFSIVDDGAYTIGSVLGSSKSVQKLQLRDLRNSRELITFFQSLMHNSSIEELSLRHSVICSKGAAVMADFLGCHKQLREFRLVDCELQENSLELICRGCKSNRTLQRMYLINTEIQSEQAIYLGDMLQEGSCLRELCLCENDLGDDGVAVLVKGLLKNTSLRHLDLRANGITAQGCLSLQGLLVSSQCLLGLGLADNEIGNLGAISLSRGLQGSSTLLESLDLCTNQIDGLGAKSLATMLRTNTRLQKINLSFNVLGDEGAKDIANALTKNSSLRLLSLRRNGITNKGATSFAHNLPKMNGLKELMLSKNKIDHLGTAALLEGLRHNVELEYLHVEDTFSEPLSKEIVYWIRLNKAGRRLFRHPNVPSTLWPVVYGRISRDFEALFHFLSEKPEVVSSAVDARYFTAIK